ncbi:MAG: TIGR03915 family putative DNA repair protein [Pontiellaceae bacterium]|nr:TIGR03915 family putative DNA repair protein [Pontiellaceae bacterium]MBN2785972.1 TIGR03915 family putative DNA repair protein [Pontiellaceae bacterium]
MELEYRYDGSPDGLLCAIADAVRRREQPALLAGPAHEGLLFVDRVHTVLTDEARADEVISYFQRKVSKEAARNLLYCLAGPFDGMELELLAYYRMGLKLGKAVDRQHADAVVHAVHQAARSVGHEIHRFKGLLRFRKLQDGLYWAPFEPDHDIISALAPHFRTRLPDQRWMMHDLRRGRAVVWDGKRLYAELQPEMLLQDNPVADDESEVQQLWQTFFRSVTIEGRKNSKLQARCMPLRYWRWLPELESF